MSVLRLTGLALLAFFIIASYEVARSPVESLFLAAHGSEALPRAWLLVAGGAVVVAGLHAIMAARLALLTVLAVWTTLAGVLLVGLLYAAEVHLPGHAWALYLWKDLYIVVLVETFWALANATTGLKQARWAYGGLLVAGTLGALAGGTLAGRVAASHGSQATVWLALPLLGGVLAVTLALRRFVPSTAVRPDARVLQADLRASLGVLWQSRSLTLLLLIVLAVQLVTTLVDYTYNGVLATAYPNADARTVVISDVYRVVNLGALVLQLGGGLVLALGLGRVFVGLPVLVGVTALALALHPVFLAAAAAKVVGKCIDYSLFRTCKEMLYIPMSYAEQTQGKALVDVLTYRVSKGGAALALQGLLWVGLGAWSPWLAVVGVAAWAGCAVWLIRRQGSDLQLAQGSKQS